MDLTPGYRELRPPDALRGLVSCLWVRVTGAADEVRVLPDGCTDLVWEQGQGTTIAGPDTTAKLVGRAPGDVLVGLRFVPGTGGGALGVPLDELRDLRVDASEAGRTFDLSGDLAPRDALAGLVSATAGREGDPIVAAAARMVGHQEISDVAYDVGISERQLRRRFHAAVGYGPQTLKRVLRLQRFVAAVDRGRSDLARLALDVGYADQAHLTREATRLTGLSPAAFVRARDVSVLF